MNAVKVDVWDLKVNIITAVHRCSFVFINPPYCVLSKVTMAHVAHPALKDKREQLALKVIQEDQACQVLMAFPDVQVSMEHQGLKA